MAKLFLQILNMSISATYLILAIVILRLFMKKAPKWVNVLLWGLVAVRLLCPFTMESMFSLIPKAQAVSPEIITQDAPDVGGVQVEMGEAGDVSVLLPDVGSTDIGVDPLPPAPVQEAPDTEALITVLAVVWAVGVLAMVIYMGLSYQTVARRVSTAFPVGERVYESENIDSAFVLGLFRPKIYLPFALDQKKKDHIRAHEQAHIRRRDHLWKPMGFLLLAVHWFNPFMWVSYVLLCRDIELACDEKVIGDLGRMERAEYSETLLSCSVNRRMISACPIAFGEKNMKGRVISVLSYQKPTFKIICLSLVACMLLSVCFLTNPVSAENTENGNQNEETTTDTAAVEAEIMEEAPAEEFVLPEDSDPLLVSWYEFVETRTIKTDNISLYPVFGCSPGAYNETLASIYACESNENAILEVLDYFKSLQPDFIGVREMTDPLWKGLKIPNRDYETVAIAFYGDETNPVNKLHISVKEDGTLLVQDESRCMELWTESGAVDYDEFWDFIYLSLNKYALNPPGTRK